MNKQQLAAKIWNSAEKMRQTKIDASEYKDYVLGIIFYKFLSDKEEKFLKSEDWKEEDIVNDLNENDVDTVKHIQSNIGYFISYKNLFSNWIRLGNSFNIGHIHDALSAFNRLIDKNYNNVFEKIFVDLETKISKLGTTTQEQTKAIRDLIFLINAIPMDGHQDYDVLGYIYEYLISNFAANAGKKAGEFYTPHEVSLLMSDIVANHLQSRKEITIFDSTSGSGSLLINIGKSVARYMKNSDGIKYYAQEIKPSTYNLTRMNLVMRGINPANICTRNADTLEEDWPWFDESDPAGTYEPLYVDAVVSNPPYSLHWHPENKENDPRYRSYGLAPKTKADYAFLLHDLYHIKPDGIMTIVLPHGVLFRGGEEGKIRQILIENNHIDCIIGLPANIFFGTGIPTIIMVLRQKRKHSNVLIIDASKGFEKSGTKNKLRASDIKRIVDCVVNRVSIGKFSKVVERDEIRANDYNLNIPRYVDSSEISESWDIYASMFGGIPANELNAFEEFWLSFPGLKRALFEDLKNGYHKLKVNSIKDAVLSHKSVIAYQNAFREAFAGFDTELNRELVQNTHSVNVASEESVITNRIFSHIKDFALIDPYYAYQIFINIWHQISNDLEMIQTEGFDAARQVDPNMVIKKNGTESEEQKGWIGHIIPFDLAQKALLSDRLSTLQAHENRLSEIADEYTSILDEMDEEDKERLLNDNSDDENDDADDDSKNAKETIDMKEIQSKYNDIISEISSDEIATLEQYLKLGNRKKDKQSFISTHALSVNWERMNKSADGTYNATEIKKYMATLKMEFTFEPGSYEDIVSRLIRLNAEEKELKKCIKDESIALHLITKETIEQLTDTQVKELLADKWITPIMDGLHHLTDSIMADFVAKLESLAKKYDTTFEDVENRIRSTSNALCGELEQLTGNDSDIVGLAEFKKLLGG